MQGKLSNNGHKTLKLPNAGVSLSTTFQNRSNTLKAFRTSLKTKAVPKVFYSQMSFLHTTGRPTKKQQKQDHKNTNGMNVN